MKLHHRRKSQVAANAWPVTYRWVAAGTLAVYSAIGCSRVSAQAPVAQDPNQVAAQPSAPTRRFAIPPGTIKESLDLFTGVTKIKVRFTDQRIEGLASQGASGVFTDEEVLARLFKNTGARYRFTSPDRLVVELNSVASTVEVSASAAALSYSVVKYTEPLRDTPQTVNVVGQKTLQEQNTTTLRDALRNVAGISIAAGEGGAQGDNLTIRGFSARNDLYIDGMRDFGSYYRDPFNLEEIDVIQGPASSTFGRGSTGGVVNQATKVPTVLRNIGASFDGGTDGTRRATVDVNVPFKVAGEASAFRVNLMGTEGGVAGRDVAHNRRYGFAPSLTFGLGTPTRVTLSYLKQQADDTPDYGIPWLFNQPAPVDRHNYYGFRHGNYLNTKDDIATTRIEHDFHSHFSLRNQTRYARYRRDVRITEPQLLGTVTLATPLSAIVTNRNELAANSVEAFLANQTDLTANFETGRIRHTTVAGVELDREDSDPTRPRYTNVPTTMLLNPNPDQPFAGTAILNTLVRARSNSVAAYAMDTAKLGQHWELSGSFRFDRFNSHYTQAVPPASAFNRLDYLKSWRAGVVYKPVAPLSIYASAGTSYNPSAESLSLSSTTVSLPPESNRTIEGGVKWDLPHPNLSLRTAVFRTDKLNAREPDPNNSLLNVLAGRQRVNGVQAEVSGHVTKQWEMQNSYALLDAHLTASNYYPAAIGARLANVPRHTFATWHTYNLPWRTKIGAGGNFVGSRTSSSTAPLDAATKLIKQAPGYWVFNAMIERAITERATLHANVYNLADRYYYDQLHPSHIVLGPARSALIGIRFHF